MKKSLKVWTLLTLSGLLLTVYGQGAIAQEDSQESSTEEVADNTDDVRVAESELQLDFNEAVGLFEKEYPNAQIEKIEVELRDNKYKMTIKGFDSDNEYDIEYKFGPVEVMNQDVDSDSDDDDDDEESLDLKELITIDEASRIALKEAGEGEITDWDLDSDDDRIEWELEIQLKEGSDDDDDDNKLHIKIDAKTGDVLETELDD